jgi:hypothetical protein
MPAGVIARRKQHYEVSTYLGQYLYHYHRYSEIPLVYDDLAHFEESIPYENPAGEETLWQTVMYPPEVRGELHQRLTRIYAVLKIGGDMRSAEHLTVERIDFGAFGNSRPFRVRVTNQFNGNSDYYYVKVADASRIYGLELEHILSPNRINYLGRGNTLIEEHIAGVPGDVFIRDYLPEPKLNVIRVAKEFVKFGERSFVRLLGDMRSVNYVVDITPDFEETQYRVRSIDFDQQSHEGRLAVYRAQFFEDNRPVEQLVRGRLNDPTIRQYRHEERSQMARRARAEAARLQGLLRAMARDTLAPEEHVRELGAALADYHGERAFARCQTMGELTARQIRTMLGL